MQTRLPTTDWAVQLRAAHAYASAACFAQLPPIVLTFIAQPSFLHSLDKACVEHTPLAPALEVQPGTAQGLLQWVAQTPCAWTVYGHPSAEHFFTASFF